MDVSERTPRKSESDRPRLQVSKFHFFNQSSQRLLLLSIQTSFDSHEFEDLLFFFFKQWTLLPCIFMFQNGSLEDVVTNILSLRVSYQVPARPNAFE